MSYRVVSFGDLLKEYKEKMGWGISKFLRARKYVPLEDVKKLLESVET